MNIEQTTNHSQKIKELEEENKLLFDQLHVVQEKLEVYFNKCKELESLSAPSVEKIMHGWVGEALPTALAELQRLEVLSETQAQITQIEHRNRLDVRLGNVLLSSSKSFVGICKLPFALINNWYKGTRKKPPATLGGESFELVFKAYEDRGFVGVRSLLKADNLSQAIKGNAYTALARYLMSRDLKAAAESAMSAFEVDPKPYRLKWLACRIHESGDLLKAEALVAILPHDINFSDSERKQINQIKSEAKKFRIAAARSKSQIDAKQEQVEKRLSELIKQITSLNEEKQALIVARDEQTLLAAGRQEEIESLRQMQAALEASKIEAERRNEALTGELAALGQEKAGLLEEKQALIVARDEQSLLAVSRQEEIDSLRRMQAELEAKRSEGERRNEALAGELAALGQEKAGLLEEKQALTVARDEQSLLAVGRQEEIESLRRMQAALEAAKSEAERNNEALAGQVANLAQEKAGLLEEKQALTVARDEQAALATGRQQEIESLRQAQSALDASKIEADRRNEALAGELAALAQEKAGLLEEKNVLTAALERARVDAETKIKEFVRQQQLVEIEMVRAETQIGLIKDLVLRDNGL